MTPRIHKTLKKSVFLIGCSISALAIAGGGHQYGPYPKQYVEECGSCHTPYPPQRMTADGWKVQMANLGEHYGTDASLDQTTQIAISNYLMTNAGLKSKYAPTEPTARMTKAEWFTKKHGTTPPKGEKFTNCNLCHKESQNGDFMEDTLKPPIGWKRPD